MFLAQIIEISTGMLTPLIAIITTYIAWQQWKTSKLKLNLERYDRRLRVYEEVIKILSIVMVHAKASDEDLLNFKINVSQADFLFGAEVPNYINEICNKAVSLRLHNQRASNHPNYDNSVQKEHETLAWLASQFKDAKEIFKKYLDISK